MDKAAARVYLAPRMKGLAHFLAAVLVALFAAGSVVHTVGAAVTDLKMAVAAADGMNMPDCEGCGTGGGDDPASICDIPCITPALAALDVAAAIPRPISVAAQSVPTDHSLTGRTGPPDPYPPRPLVLS